MRFVFQISILLLVMLQDVIIAKSYFFEDDESNAILALPTIKQETFSKKRKEKTKVKKKISYKLSGILFVNSANWVVWINDKPYSTVGKHGDFSINHVSNHSVHLTFENGHSILLTLNVGSL